MRELSRSLEAPGKAGCSRATCWGGGRAPRAPRPCHSPAACHWAQAAARWVVPVPMLTLPPSWQSWTFFSITLLICQMEMASTSPFARCIDDTDLCVVCRGPGTWWLLPALQCLAPSLCPGPICLAGVASVLTLGSPSTLMQSDASLLVPSSILISALYGGHS